MRCSFKSILILLVCSFTVNYASAQSASYLNRCNLELIEVMIEDIFSPPVASRNQVYPNIAAYEILTKKYKQLKPLAGQLTQLTSIPEPKEKVDYSLAAEVGFIETAKKFIYSEYILDDFLEKEIKAWKQKGVDTVLINNSKTYGKQVALHIIEWAKKDNYIHTRTLERYVQSDSLGAWRPTGPEYMNALEPNWYLMRSLVCDSSNYVKAMPNFPYSENKKSIYYKNAMQVYKQSLKKDSAAIKTAYYWDDNPNTSISKGHLTYFIHKATPGGHWIKITSQIALEKKLTEMQTTELLTMVALGEYEGFLSCWAEKYNSNAVRPETYINKLIAPKWMPLIETPPFPEYTSGHSVVSATASSMLTHFVPLPHAFTDSSQVYLDIKPRPFKNFKEASDQASMSRFYGGIHYIPSLKNGEIQGRQIVDFILKKINTRQ